MTTIHPELHSLRQFQGLILPAHPMSGTEDDDAEEEEPEEEEPEEETAAPQSAVAVPEPATRLGFGLAAVGLARRRKARTRPV